MSVLADIERNTATEDSVSRPLNSDASTLINLEHRETKQSCDSMESSRTNFVDPAEAHTNRESRGIPEMFNGFQRDSLNSLDVQLTSQILSSIRNKMLTNTSGHIDVLPDLVEQNNADLVAVKQEIPEDLVEFHSSRDHITQSPQTSFPVLDSSSMNSCSVLSPESYSLNQSPDSSDFTNYQSAMFSNSSLHMNRLININHSSVSQSELSQTSGSRSDVPNTTCDSSEAVVTCASKLVTKQTNLLPPCRVCGNKASGFHYGANTCEACKGFFRRSLKKDKSDFKCNGDSTCKMQTGRRNNCTLCRYNRCLSAGMSKDAIKTGRYTHEKRTQDIVEVKKLNGEISPHMLQPASMKRECFKIKTLSDENREMLDSIYSAHKILFPLWHKVLDSGSNKIVSKRYAEKYKLQERLKAETCSSHMLPEEYDNYSNKKGIEPERRKDAIEELTQHIELAIVTFVRYAKAVPGFTELSLNDQAALVKLSRFEVWMIGAHKFMDLNLKVVSGPRGKAYHMDELSELLDEGFVNSMFAFAHSMQEINLTNEETALLKCVVLMFTDRCELQDPDKVEEIQQRLTECLEELLGSSQRFAKVMNALIRLRNLTEWSKTISETMIMEWPNIQKHPLLLEIMSV